jgi:hypothetical protein
MPRAGFAQKARSACPYMNRTGPLEYRQTMSMAIEDKPDLVRTHWLRAHHLMVRTAFA